MITPKIHFWLTCLSAYLITFGCVLGQSSLLPSFTLINLQAENISFKPSTETAAEVFIFILHDCPIANQYQPLIRRLSHQFSDRKIKFHLIHADPTLTPDAAREHAKLYEIEAPIYLDPKHKAVKLFGATVTPEVFVINSNHELVYQGRIDNLYFALGRKRFRATQHDLLDALEALLSGSPVPTPKTKALGCYVPPLDTPPLGP